MKLRLYPGRDFRFVGFDAELYRRRGMNPETIPIFHVSTPPGSSIASDGFVGYVMENVPLGYWLRERARRIRRSLSIRLALAWMWIKEG